MKTSELTGAALDWAVAKAAGYNPKSKWMWATGCFIGTPPVPFHPSTEWSQGGPIIEHEGITVRCIGENVFNLVWCALPYEDEGVTEIEGDTPLIAAMRCYVASKLGDEIDAPAELC